jgi:hypothetical protein
MMRFANRIDAYLIVMIHRKLEGENFIMQIEEVQNEFFSIRE